MMGLNLRGCRRTIMSTRSDKGYRVAVDGVDPMGLRTVVAEYSPKSVHFGSPGAWRIGSVIPPHQNLIHVGPRTSLNQVKTKLTMSGLSQVPVLKNNRSHLIGTVTWRSLASYGSEGVTHAQQAIVPGRVPKADFNDLLMDRIQEIIDYDYIYVKKQEIYMGIVTTTDLARTFLAVSGPFMKLREVETHLRELLRKLPIEKVRSAAGPIPDGFSQDGASRQIDSIDDMSFGQYRSIFQDRDLWAEMALPYDRRAVLDNLRDVNRARNAVMHFRPEPLAPEQAWAIDQALNWLRECSNAKSVTPSWES